MRLSPGEYTNDKLEQDYARQEFYLEAIERVVPEVLEDLHDNVLPLFHEAGTEDFENALEQWAKKYNLDYKWAKKLARWTVERWAKHFANRNKLKWSFYPVMYWGKEPDPMNITVQWDPMTESRKDAEVRISKTIFESMNEIERQAMETSFRVSTEKRKLIHFEWLALHEVKRLSCKEIENRYRESFEATGSKPDKIYENKAIYDGIKKAADSINLPLKPLRKGRKPKSK